MISLCGASGGSPVWGRSYSVCGSTEQNFGTFSQALFRDVAYIPAKAHSTLGLIIMMRWVHQRGNLGSVMSFSASSSYNEDVRVLNRLYQAYIGLGVALPQEDGSRMMPLARIGAFELRLLEFAEHRGADSADFWFELYCRESRMSLDSCRCRDLEVAESIANDFMVLARELNERKLYFGKIPPRFH